MNFHKIKTAAVALLFVALTSAAVAEKIDNPAYQNWAKYKVGSFVSYKTTAVGPGYSTEIESTQTLVELTAEKAVIEMKGSMSLAGQKIDQPAQKMEIHAKLDKPEGVAAPSATVKQLEKGEEAIEVKGAKIKTKWVKTEMTVAGTTAKSQSWTSDEVPATLVKSVTKSEGAAASETTMVLVDFKADKK